jgi:hypothetical protein
VSEERWGGVARWRARAWFYSSRDLPGAFLASSRARQLTAHGGDKRRRARSACALCMHHRLSQRGPRTNGGVRRRAGAPLWDGSFGGRIKRFVAFTGRGLILVG